MATYDAVGVPIPMEHPEFKIDFKLNNKIRKLESLKFTVKISCRHPH